MTDPKTVRWEISPHTQAKHAILKNYLDAWMPILTKETRTSSAGEQREVLIIDGFAGPGRYSGGERGSPLIALNSALDHPTFPVPIRMMFVEKDPERYQCLLEETNRFKSCIGPGFNVDAVDVRNGDCTAEIFRLLDDLKKRGIQFGPAFAFLDQFGYGEVSMKLIKRILSFDKCEVFTYLEYQNMNRWLTDPAKDETRDRTFGSDIWRECLSLAPHQRRTRMLELYKEALQKLAGADYVIAFVIFDKKNQPLYWLIFCTNHLKGLLEMKRAMWKVDSTGDFRFSDRDDPSQIRILETTYTQSWLADELMAKFRNRTIAVSDLMKHVLVETPCYLYKDALALLESQGRLKIRNAPSGRRAGTFRDDWLEQILVKFEPDLFA